MYMCEFSVKWWCKVVVHPVVGQEAARLGEDGRSQTIRHMVGHGLKKAAGRERGRDALDLPHGTSI